jgi:GNAT superfamily N-acetyltransferase
VTTHLNPGWLDPGDYVSFLNRAFPGQWDPSTYRWYFARSFGGRQGDLLVQADGSTLCAGLAMIPRQVVVDEGAPIDVAILVAGATLPSERGRGRYAQLLYAALDRARQLGYVAMLGFVTAANASRRALLRMGARAVPSFYILSAEGVPVRSSGRIGRVSPIALERAATLFRRPRADRWTDASAPLARFHYAHDADWHRQFIDRPEMVRARRIRHDSIALIESVRGTDRLQCLECPGDKRAASIGVIAAASAAARQRFFTYTLDPCEAAGARRLGLRARAGYLLVLPTGLDGSRWKLLAAARWQVQSGDRL